MSERYQREIEDLLRRLDTGPAREPFASRLSRRTARLRAGLAQALRGFLRRPPVEQFMIASIALLLAALILQLVPPLAVAARWASIVSILLFVLAIGVSIAHRRAGGASLGYGDRYWRGQVIDYRPRSTPLWWRIRQWWRRRFG